MTTKFVELPANDLSYHAIGSSQVVRERLDDIWNEKIVLKVYPNLMLLFQMMDPYRNLAQSHDILLPGQHLLFSKFHTSPLLSALDLCKSFEPYVWGMNFIQNGVAELLSPCLLDKQLAMVQQYQGVVEG